MLRKLSYTAFALAMLTVGAWAATTLTFSFGPTWVPAGPALFAGSDFQILTNAVNTLRNQADGTTAGTYKGAFTGTMAPTSGVTASPRNVSIGNLVPAVSTDFTNSTPVITEVYIGEVFVPANMTVTGVAVFDGSAASGGGNVKVGLANSAGAVVATSASTAGGSNDAYALVPFTAPVSVTGPATYYILSIYDTATAGFYNAPPLGSFGCAKQTGQVYATGFTTITPPTTFTANLCNVASLY